MEGIVVVTSLQMDYYSKPWVEKPSLANTDSSCDHPTDIWQTKESVKPV